MSACCVCGDRAEWAWQPFGPDESYKSFMLPGAHYRGFPALHVCDGCKRNIEDHSGVEFTYKGKRYITCIQEGVLAVPDYVSDPLLWLEESLDHNPLYAAAPDLLAACEAAIAAIAALDGTVQMPPTLGRNLAAARVQLQDAVKKARGEEG